MNKKYGSFIFLFCGFKLPEIFNFSSYLIDISLYKAKQNNALLKT